VQIDRPANPGDKAWIQFEYSRPQTIHAITFLMTYEQTQAMGWMGVKMNGPRASRSKRRWSNLPAGRHHSNQRRSRAHAVVCIPVTAKYFRVSVTTPPPPHVPRSKLAAFGVKLPKPSPTYTIAELTFSPWRSGESI
jgi:hypothetical protein